jgi:hypothetical protein
LKSLVAARVMKKHDFELLSVEEMRRKYGLTAENRPGIRLDPENVPEALRHLIPLAELWGVGDDLIRDDMVRRAPPSAIAELRRVIEEHDDLLDDWLAGPAAEGPTFSPEYTAFSAMRMAADFA